MSISSTDGEDLPPCKKRKLNTSQETIEEYKKLHLNRCSDDLSERYPSPSPKRARGSRACPSECSHRSSSTRRSSMNGSQTPTGEYGSDFLALLDIDRSETMLMPSSQLANDVAAIPTSGCPVIHAPVPWYRCPDFKRRWCNVVNESKRYPIDWYCLSWMPLESFDECFACIMTYILEDLCPKVRLYKIGITDNPVKRWHMYMDRVEQEPWERMHICYVAPTSKWRPNILDSIEEAQLKKTSTGAMERRLIEGCQRHHKLYNREEGGDCPSDGSPHYVYIVTERWRRQEDMIDMIE